MKEFEFDVYANIEGKCVYTVFVKAESLEMAMKKIEGMLIDEPITPILELIRNFCDNYPAKLIILTGREDTPEIRKATEEWLENNFLHPDILLMRPAKSFIAGPVCKKKLYEDNVKGKFYIPFVLEDNAKCVAMWRDEGLICLQPNEGKF